MPFICKQEEIEVDTLNANIKIEKEKREVHTNLRLQHVQDIIKLQAIYEIQYKENYNYQSLQTSILIPKDKSALVKVYISKRPIGHIFMVCKNI